jgi:hypothetical protein
MWRDASVVACAPWFAPMVSSAWITARLKSTIVMPAWNVEPALKTARRRPSRCNQVSAAPPPLSTVSSAATAPRAAALSTQKKTRIHRQVVLRGRIRRRVSSVLSTHDDEFAATRKDLPQRRRGRTENKSVDRGSPTMRQL